MKRKKVVWLLASLVFFLSLAIAGWKSYRHIEKYSRVDRNPSARTFDNMRRTSAALETYFVDYGLYPPAIAHPQGGTVVSPALTTPIAYQHALLDDGGFRQISLLEWMIPALGPKSIDATLYRYATDRESSFILVHPGPDGDWDITRPEEFLYEKQRQGDFSDDFLNVTYDPSNGATSCGDFWRIKD